MRSTLVTLLILSLALTHCLGVIDFSYQCRVQSGNKIFSFAFEDDSDVPIDIWVVGKVSCDITRWTGSSLGSNYPWTFDLVYVDVTSSWPANCEPTQIGADEYQILFMVKFSPVGLYSPSDNIYRATCDFASVDAVVNTQEAAVANPTVPITDIENDDPQVLLILKHANGDVVDTLNPPYNGEDVWLQACSPSGEIYTGFQMQTCQLTSIDSYLFLDADGCAPAAAANTYSHIPPFVYDSGTDLCGSTLFQWPAPTTPGLVLVISCEAEVCYDCNPSAGDSHCITRRKREAAFINPKLGAGENKEMVDVNKLYVAVMPTTELEAFRRASGDVLSQVRSADNVSQCMSLTGIITSLCVLGFFLFIALGLAVFLYCRGRRSQRDSDRTLAKVGHTSPRM